MAKCHVEVTLIKCVQDSQEFGSNDEHMVSRVSFRIGRQGEPAQDGFADVKQTVGSSYASGPLEVGRPQGYRGPVDYGHFQREVEAYYRSLVGPTASGVKVPGAVTARMRNNTFNKRHTFVMEAEDTGGAW